MKNFIGNITTTRSTALDTLGGVVNASLLVTDSTHLGKLASAKRDKTKISIKQINIRQVGSK